MKILHVTDEFSKKNYSISSLINFLKNLLIFSEEHEVKILGAKIDKKLFHNFEADIINDSSWFGVLFKSEKIKKKIKNSEIIHIHGIWAPIQIFTIFYCNLIGKKLVIHPHGMLLQEALKSTGSIKYVIKIISLFILRILIKRNIFFISITNQETQAIKKYFTNNLIQQISNPIPFNLSDQETDKKEKQIIYLGRIHPHKNIDLLISAFMKANLSDDWKLKIYGIRDDDFYYKKILKIIKHEKNIEIFDPIFDDQRQNLMSSSWINILVSKSEVLSLSILESSYYGLPTISNNKIELDQVQESIIPTHNSVEEIKDKIIEVSNWTYDYRIKKGREIKKQFKKNYLLSDTKASYDNFYNNIIKDSKKVISEKTKKFEWPEFILKENFNFLAISGVYTFNLMFSSLLVILMAFFKNYSMAAELGLTISLWISITQIFSSNMRSIIISENNTHLANDTFLYRFIFSIFAFFIFLIISKLYFNPINEALILSISILILSQWCFEMSLVKYEIKNKVKIFYIFLILNSIFIFLATYLIIISKIDLLPIIFTSYIIFLFLFSIKNLFVSIKTLKNIIRIFQRNLNTIAFASSLSIISSSFIWRLLIYTLFEKNIAGIFYACFSIGSFPGTFFNSVIGPTYVKKKLVFNNNFKIFSKILLMFLFILFLSTSYKIYELYKIDLFLFTSVDFMIFVTTISLIGSFFMIQAMHTRQKQTQENLILQKLLFKKDILYGISIIFFVPILYLVGNIFATSFAFCLTSIFAYAIYTNKKV